MLPTGVEHKTSGFTVDPSANFEPLGYPDRLIELSIAFKQLRSKLIERERERERESTNAISTFKIVSSSFKES